MPNNRSVKKGQELMCLSYLEGRLQAERSPEDLRSWAGSKQPLQKQLRAVVKK